MDIIFTGALLIFSIYCFFLVGAQSPAPTPTELGAAFWPRIILVLLVILLIVNLINILKTHKEQHRGAFADIDVMGFLKSKLFIGMILVAVVAIILPFVGFIPACLLFLISYGFLLGERRIVRLIIISAIITIVLYVIFQGALSIMLARGTGIFRNFAIFCESLISFRF